MAIELRQSEYLSNLVEKDHRANEWRTRPMMGFKSFWSATRIIAGVETMHMINKRQLRCPGGPAFSSADNFYSLAREQAGEGLPCLVRPSMLGHELRARTRLNCKRFGSEQTINAFEAKR